MNLVTFIIFLMLLLSGKSHARISPEFIFVGQDLEPFYFKDGSVGIQGAIYDVMKEVCAKENLICKFKIAPFRQALSMVKKGNAQAGGPFAISVQRETVLYYTAPIFRSNYVFLASADLAKKIKSYDNMAGLTVAAMAPSNTWISLHRVNEITGNKMKLGRETTELNSIRKTENKNYAVAYVPQELAHAYFRHNRSNLREIPMLGEPFDFYLTFSKEAVSKEEFNKINDTIKNLTKSDFIKQIAEKYSLQLPGQAEKLNPTMKN